MTRRLPWMKWYSRDALGDPALRLCTPNARGVWYDMLWLMDVSDRRGYLTRNGTQYPDDDLCRVLGLTIEELQDAKDTLIKCGVPSIEEGTGIWFNRRMVRDEMRRQAGSFAGRAGGGNPALRHTPIPPGEKTEHQEARGHMPEARTPIKECAKGTYKGEDGKSLISDLQEVPSWTLDHVLSTAAKPTVAVLPDVARSYFDQRARRDWLDGTGRQCARTQAALEADLRHYAQVTAPNIKAAAKIAEQRAAGIPGVTRRRTTTI